MLLFHKVETYEILQFYKKTKPHTENGLHNGVSDTGVKMYSIKLNGDHGLFAE